MKSEFVPIKVHACVYDAQKQKCKRTHVFSSSCCPRDPQKLGSTQTSLQLSWRIPMCSINPPFCLRGHVYTENAIWHFAAFKNETKSNSIYRTEKKVWWRSSGDFGTQETCFFFQMVLRNKMSPSTVECKMHIVHACKVPLDKESVCKRAIKKFQHTKRRKKYCITRYFHKFAVYMESSVSVIMY